MLFSFYSKLVVVATGLISAAQSKDIYVSPSGTGSGSQSVPYGSIQAAVNVASAGDVILLRAGTYKPTTNIQITKSGTAASPITLRSYQEEKVIVDGESLPG
jgi:pectin methylesterase-like acyl-CoA thioesterase